MTRLVTLALLTCVPLLWTDVALAQNYQTFCYKRQENRLVGKENCTVEMSFDSSENGLKWRIVTSSGQVQQYRNLGLGIELWNPQKKQWALVLNTDWFPGIDNILCWDDFCANWTDIPID